MEELPVIVRNYNNIEAMTIALVENLQREDLNSIDEAKALNELKNAHNLSQEELAEKIGKSRSNVANTLRLLALPEYIKTMIAEDAIKAGHGRALLSVTNQKDQEILAKRIVEINFPSEKRKPFWNTGKNSEPCPRNYRNVKRIKPENNGSRAIPAGKITAYRQ